MKDILLWTVDDGILFTVTVVGLLLIQAEKAVDRFRRREPHQCETARTSP